MSNDSQIRALEALAEALHGHEVEDFRPLSPLTVSRSDLTRDEYVAEVKAMPRDRVTSDYSTLYREVDSLKWEYENALDEEGLPHEEFELDDEDVTRFAEQDYHDGPDAWAFPAREGESNG